MDLKDFIICLKKKADTKTPLTIDFDKEHGQEKNRWWDNLENCEDISSQKYHVLGHFLCWYYQGAPSNCTSKNPECGKCYSEKLAGLNLTDTADKSGEYSVSGIFNGMRRPEMYIYIAEALNVFDEDGLKEFVENIKNAIDNNESWKKVINKERLWDRVEKKAKEILEPK